MIDHMERDGKRPIKSTEFPDKDDVASVIGTLYDSVKTYFEEKEFKPKILIENYYSDGSISQIAFKDLPWETAWELANLIRNKRANGWTHVEAHTDAERKNKSWVRLFADAASVRKINS